MQQKPHYLDSQHNQILKGKKILLAVDIKRFNELDESFAMQLIITEQDLVLADKQKTERVVAIEDIESITLSQLSTEIIIHFFEDPDERINSSESQLQIAEMIVYLKTSFFSDNPNNKFPVYFVQEVNLDMYVTTEEDLEDGHTIRPEDEDMKMLTYQQFRQMYENQQQNIIRDRKSTKTLYSQTNNKVTKDDFEFLKVLGKGSHGKVLLCCRKKQPEKLYAMKILKKQHIIEAKQLEHTRAEKLILQHVNHPFLVSLKHSFQTGPKIYFVLEFMKGGELFQHLRRVKRFTEEQTKFLAACLVLGLGHLHNKDYIYRDLKPENVLLDEKGYAKLTDFGLAKFLKVQEVATTFCGTPEYLSPEVILDKGCNRPADWWALGTLIYEMIFGIPPFYSRNVQKMYKNIILKQLKFKESVELSAEGKNFIENLLVKNPAKRLGSIADSLEVMNHEWFRNFDWTKLIEKQLKSPYNPIQSEKDWIKNFDPSFTKQKANDSICFIDPKFIEQFKKDFEDFDFEPSHEDHKQTEDSEVEDDVKEMDVDSPQRSYSSQKQDKNKAYMKRLKSTPKKNMQNFKSEKKASDFLENPKKILKFQIDKKQLNCQQMQAQTGTLENLTAEQKQVKQEIEKYLFEELKESRERWNDWTILRFCRARKFDVIKVKEMIKKNVDFINKINLQRLAQVDHDVYKPLQEVTWNGYCNTDKLGRPIYIEFARGMKAKECFSRFSDDELVDYYIQSYERMVNIAFPEASKQAGKRIDRTLTIIDLKDVSLFKMFTGKTKAFVNLGTTITQDNYPELMGQTFIINTGYFFSGIWSIVKGWLDPVTRQKISIISGSGKKELLEMVDEDKLPVELGGKFEGDIRQNYGPWKEALEKSYKTKTLQHPDKKVFAQYFLSEQEKKQ